MTVHVRRTLTAVAALCALAAAGLTGCSSRTVTGLDAATILQSGSSPLASAPVPNSPAGALRLFEWTYNRRSMARYRELFSEDFRFHFSPLDSAGNTYRNTPWTLNDELISTTHLFVRGHPVLPPATIIRLVLDKNFFVFPDQNHAAWDPEGRRHKVIRTQAVLNVLVADGSRFDISGAVSFCLVRGDSARIPEELRLRGFGPDSVRWYIQRWDDETAQPEGNPAQAPRVTDAQPSRSFTWGMLKFMYR